MQYLFVTAPYADHCIPNYFTFQTTTCCRNQEGQNTQLSQKLNRFLPDYRTVAACLSIGKTQTGEMRGGIFSCNEVGESDTIPKTPATFQDLTPTGVFKPGEQIIGRLLSEAMIVLEKFRQRARHLKTETFALYLAARDPQTPWYAKVLVAGIVAYAFSPIDLIPDFVPVLGYLDDLILIPLGIALAIRLVPHSVLVECRIRAKEWFGVRS